MAFLSVWTGLACAGGTRIQDIEPVTFQYGSALDNTQTCVATVPSSDTAALAALSIANVLRVQNELGNVSEYFISNLRLGRADPIATVTGKPVELLLNRVLVRGKIGTRQSTRVSDTRTASEWMSLYILPSLAAYGQSFWSLGTIQTPTTSALAFVDETCMWLVRQILTARPEQLIARRNGEVGYYLDLIVPALTPMPLAEVGSNVTVLSREIDDTAQATVIVPAGQAFAANDEPERIWYVPQRAAAIAGTAITLDDPTGLGTTILGSDGQPRMGTLYPTTGVGNWRLGCVTAPMLWYASAGGCWRAVYLQSTKVLWGVFYGGLSGIVSLNAETRALGTRQTTSLTNPKDAAYTASTDTLYVVDNGGARVTPYTTAGPTAGTPITVGTGPRRILWVPDGALNRYLIGHDGSNAIKQIDPTTNTVTATSPAMTTPAHLDHVSQTQVYAASDTSDAVYRYNASGNTLTTTISTGLTGNVQNSAASGYAALVYLPTLSEVWACQRTIGTVPPTGAITVIDTTTDLIKLFIVTTGQHGAIQDALVLNGNVYGVTDDGLLVCYTGSTHTLAWKRQHGAWSAAVALRSITYLSDIDCFAIGGDYGALYFMDAQTGGAMIARALTAASAVGGAPNLALWSEALNGVSWSDNGAAGTVTADTTVAPDGNTTADTLTRISGVNDGRLQTIAFTGDGPKAISWFLKQGTSAAVDFFLYDSTAAVTRQRIRATWTAGVPVLSTTVGAGTLFTPTLDAHGFYRVAFAPAGVVAANSNAVAIVVSPIGANGDTVIAWGAQARNAVDAGAYMPTTTAISAITSPIVALANSPFPLRQYDEVVFCRDDGDPLFEMPNESAVSSYGAKMRQVQDVALSGGSNRALNGGLTWFDSSRKAARFLNLTLPDATSEAKWDGYDNNAVTTFTATVNGAQATTQSVGQSLVLSGAGAGRVFLPGDLLVGTTDFIVAAKATADGGGAVTVYAIASNSSGVANLASLTVTRPTAATLVAGAATWLALPQMAVASAGARSVMFADVNLPFIPGEMTNLYWGMTAWTFGVNGNPALWRVRVLGLDTQATLLDVYPNPDTSQLGPARGLVPMTFAGSIPLPVNCAGGHVRFNLQLIDAVVGSPLLMALYVRNFFVQVGNADRGAPTDSAARLWQLGQDNGVLRGQPLLNYTVQVREDDPTNPFLLGSNVLLRDPAQGILNATPQIVNITRTLPRTADEIVQPVLTLDNRGPDLVRWLLETTSNQP